MRDWLAGRQAIPASTPIRGYGKSTPVAPNTTADGKDDPEGRQKNRRVEVVFEGCAKAQRRAEHPSGSYCALSPCGPLAGESCADSSVYSNG